MATIKYVLQSKKENSNIYVRYSLGRNKILYRKTGFVINSKDWNEKDGRPSKNTDTAKSLKFKLSELSVKLENEYNNAVRDGIPLTGDWLQLQIDSFNNIHPTFALDILTNYIQKYIDDAPYKQNQKQQTGLSISRIKNLKLFINTIKRFEAETLKGKSILIKNIDLHFVEKFKLWLFKQKYSINYVGKNIDNIKTICIDAHKNDIETSTQIKNIKSIAEKKAPDQIVFLSEQEQQNIKDATLLREALVNARKWLLLGCSLGQRGNDLLSITAKNIKDLNGIKIIELQQQKTGKLVAIPLLPEALEIIESGLPYKISLTRFNEYIKDVCEIAEINQPTTGRVKTTSNNALKIETKPKFNFISSHVCRRSFCTNFYGRIPTPVLMNVSAHGTEKMFLSYIGKTTYDNAFQMLEYFSKLAPREIITPQLEVVHNTGTI